MSLKGFPIMDYPRIQGSHYGYKKVQSIENAKNAINWQILSLKIYPFYIFKLSTSYKTLRGRFPLVPIYSRHVHMVSTRLESSRVATPPRPRQQHCHWSPASCQDQHMLHRNYDFNFAEIRVRSDNFIILFCPQSSSQ